LCELGVGGERAILLRELIAAANRSGVLAVHAGQSPKHVDHEPWLGGIEGVHAINSPSESSHAQAPEVGGLGSYGWGDGWLQA